MAIVLGVEVFVDFLNDFGAVGVEGFPHCGEKGEPVEFAVGVEGFLDGLEFEFFEEDAVGLEGMVECIVGDESDLFWVELGEGAVDGSEVGEVFIFVELEFDLADEAVDLGVEFDSKESHK